MTVKSAPYYWLVCDACGVSSTKDGEHSAWIEEQQAVDVAKDSDWTRLEFDVQGAPWPQLYPRAVMDLCPDHWPQSDDEEAWR
jgi:hypothetical protein